MKSIPKNLAGKELLIVIINQRNICRGRRENNNSISCRGQEEKVINATGRLESGRARLEIENIKCKYKPKVFKVEEGMTPT